MSHIELINPFSVVKVFIHQSKIFIMTVDPYLKYSNKAERANQEIYDYFKFKKPFYLHGLYRIISAL